MTVIPYILLNALILVESGGNDRAVGDFVRGQPTAFGCLQIGNKVLADVRRISGHRVSRSDAFDRAKASKICILYLSHYATPERLGHEPTVEDLARIWNGGPGGWKDPATIPYWTKVNSTLETLSQAQLPIAGQNTGPRLPTIGAGMARAAVTNTGLNSGACTPPTVPANRNSLLSLSPFNDRPDRRWPGLPGSSASR